MPRLLVFLWSLVLLWWFFWRPPQEMVYEREPARSNDTETVFVLPHSRTSGDQLRMVSHPKNRIYTDTSCCTYAEQDVPNSGVAPVMDDVAVCMHADCASYTADESTTQEEHDVSNHFRR